MRLINKIKEIMQMLKFLKQIKEFISGYKTYIVCGTTILGLLVAYSEGAITAIELYQGIAAAIAGITIRAAVTKSASG